MANGTAGGHLRGKSFANTNLHQCRQIEPGPEWDIVTTQMETKLLPLKSGERRAGLTVPPVPVVFHLIKLRGKKDGRAGSAHQWAVMIHIGGVEFRQRDKPWQVVENDFSPLEGQQPVFAQLPQHAVDVYGA